jgi:putative addiction module killer protein
MIKILKTDIFNSWLKSIDGSFRARVQARIDNVINGHFGDFKALGDGVFELRFHFRSGIRVYYCQRGQEIIILLAGGNKDSQKKDIETAKRLAHQIREDI